MVLWTNFQIIRTFFSAKLLALRPLRSSFIDSSFASERCSTKQGRFSDQSCDRFLISFYFFSRIFPFFHDFITIIVEFLIKQYYSTRTYWISNDYNELRATLLVGHLLFDIIIIIIIIIITIIIIIIIIIIFRL